MSKFLVLLLRNLSRNKSRTVLTILTIVLLVSVYSFVRTVVGVINHIIGAHASQTKLIVRERWVMPSTFPARYVPKIAAVPDVQDWTTWHSYVGTFDESGDWIYGIATRVDNLREMHAEMDELDPTCIDALRRNKTGALVGCRIMDRMGWQVGQKFEVNSITHPGKDLEFTIVGELPSELWGRNLFFREDYYQEGVGDKENVDLMWLRVASPEMGRHIAAEVERLFEDSPVQLKVETESSGVGRYVGHARTVVNVIDFVALILLGDMIVIIVNTIGISVRERRVEMAILKILGFQPSFIFLVVVGEAVLLGAISGCLGAGLACTLSALNAAQSLPFTLSVLLEFPVSPSFIVHGIVLGALVGFAGSAIPAWTARKTRVAEVFSQTT